LPRFIYFKIPAFLSQRYEMQNIWKTFTGKFLNKASIIGCKFF